MPPEGGSGRVVGRETQERMEAVVQMGPRVVGLKMASCRAAAATAGELLLASGAARHRPAFVCRCVGPAGEFVDQRSEVGSMLLTICLPKYSPYITREISAPHINSLTLQGTN
jgi:hypothetical protein